MQYHNSKYYEFTIRFTNHIAHSMGLPGLFLGTFGKVSIEYIHLTTRIIGHNGLKPQCIVVKTNQALYGMTIDIKGLISPLVRLSTPDRIFALLKKYRKFPDVIEPGDALESKLIFSGGHVSHTIHHPTGSAEPSPALAAAYEQLLNEITLKSADPQNTLSAATHYQDLPDNEVGQFIEHRYMILQQFGLSGLFGQPEAPHDTEYILQISHNYRYYTFVKTAHTCYGKYVDWKQRLINADDGTIIDDVTIAEVDWQALIEVISPFPGVALGDQIKLMSVSLRLADSYQHALFEPDENSEDIPEIWHLLKPLIAQFPEG